MKKLFETIRIENGIAHNLKYHNARLNHARKHLFGTTDDIDIEKYLIDIPSSGLYRAKLIYDRNIQDITYYIYKAKTIQTFRLLGADINYRYKYLNRVQLDTLIEENQEYDEIIIIKDELLTDTTIANIALRQDGIWYTPAEPLLQGTTRARLLDEGKIITKNIKATDIDSYDGLALMNAMIGFRIIDRPKIR
ncbi:MAG TPA: hypothetical protein EYG98_01490 [Sulfurovum sp.]|nr:hypothetical protein [Sulfurovum sp.]